MKPTVKLVTSGKGTAGLQKSLAELSRMQVYVGVPEKKTARKKGTITNAQLIFIHTHGVRTVTARRRMTAMMLNRNIGYSAALALYKQSKGSPLFAIPPRPVIEPAIEVKNNREVIQEDLKLAAVSALDGNKTQTVHYLNVAGMEAQNRVRAWFTDPRNHWAPNAPSTIRRKGSAQPLIDQGEMRKSIVYLVDEGTQ